MIVAQHTKPIIKRDCIDTWKAEGRIPIKREDGWICDYLVVSIEEDATINGLHLDAYIAVRSMLNDQCYDWVARSMNPTLKLTSPCVCSGGWMEWAGFIRQNRVLGLGASPWKD